MILLVTARNVGFADWLLLLFPSLLLEADDPSKPGLSSLSSSEQLIDAVFEVEDQLDDALLDAAEAAEAGLENLASSLSRSMTATLGEGGSGFGQRKGNRLVGEIVEDANRDLDNEGHVELQYRGEAGDEAYQRKQQEKNDHNHFYGKDAGGVSLGAIPSYG
jgi:hypothetical protein